MSMNGRCILLLKLQIRSYKLLEYLIINTGVFDRLEYETKKIVFKLFYSGTLISDSWDIAIGTDK